MDGHDYDVISIKNNNMVIDNIKAMSDRQAAKLARAKWGNDVAVRRVI